ncbi:hypothetical protein ACFL11_01635 [Patescibacteria group bacterium]
MKPTKIFGWLLLIIGVTVIFYSLYSSFNIFTGTSESPEIFELTGLEPFGVSVSVSGISDPQEKIEQIVKEQLNNMVPADSLSRFFNLIVWAIFSAILIFGGAQLSNIGIDLMRR